MNNLLLEDMVLNIACTKNAEKQTVVMAQATSAIQQLHQVTQPSPSAKSQLNSFFKARIKS